MGIAILVLAAILVLVVVAFRRAPDRSAASHPQAKWLLWTALVFIGIFIAFLLYFGIAEMISGDLSGAAHLASAVTLAALLFLAWRRPLEGGVALVSLGVLATLYYVYPVLERGEALQLSSWMGGAPFLASGLFFLAAMGLARRT